MEVDPVILQLRADVNKYLVDLRTTTSKVDGLLDQQEKSARDLEREMKRSTGAIGGHMRTLAGTLATYFTGRELVGLLDSFTRLQNNLRVAGLEGTALAKVQESLLSISQRYGVGVEELSGVFLKASLAQKELGVSTAQIVQLNEITAASLKITGTSAAEAQGALLQLGQALGAGTVRAEEFNSIIEGALPLAQAAARGIDGMEGSVSKLRTAVVNGEISSRQFFEGILKGGVQTLQDAEKATLTLAGGFTALTSALTVYFGEADKANGVSAALGETLGFLADNLDTIIPALAVIAAAMGVRYVAGAVAAAGATVLASNAIFALQARALGAATSMEALAFAMNGLRGGIVTAAILALGAALYYAQQEMFGTKEATGQYAAELDRANKATQKAEELANKLATARGKEREQTLAAARAERELTKQKIASAKASVDQARAELARASARYADLQAGAAQAGSISPEAAEGAFFGATVVGAGGENQAKANLKAAQKSLAAQQKRLKIIEAAIDGGPPGVAPVSPGKDGKKSGASSGSSGPSATEIEARFQAERNALAQQALSAMQAVATSAEERAEYELRSVELARIRAISELKAEKDYSAAQKEILIAQVEELAQRERDAIEFAKNREIEQDTQRLADERYRVASEDLQIQYDLADTQAERKRIALEMVDLENRYQRSLLEAITASETATDAEKQRAQIALEALGRLAAGDRARAERRNETASERYLRDLNKSPEQINEAIEGIKIDGLDALNDGLVDALRGVKSLGDVFKNVADQIIADLLRIAVQRAIIGPLANAIFGAGVGGHGGGGDPGGALGLSSLIGGRASGGPVIGGRLYRVNEGASPGRVEGFMPTGSGDIIPLGRMNVAGGSGGNGHTSINVTVNAKDAVLTQQVQSWVREGVVSAVQLATATGGAEGERRITQRQRRRIPG